MTPGQLISRLVPLAAELVGTVRDYGPDDVAALLDPLTPGHWYRLCIVLAAMVDPDARPADLLAWITPAAPSPVPARAGRRRVRTPTGRPPGKPRLPREHGTERGYYQHRTHRDPACRPCLDAHTAANQRRTKPLDNQPECGRRAAS